MLKKRFKTGICGGADIFIDIPLSMSPPDLNTRRKLNLSTGHISFWQESVKKPVDFTGFP